MDEDDVGTLNVQGEPEVALAVGEKPVLHRSPFDAQDFYDVPTYPL